MLHGNSFNSYNYCSDIHLTSWGMRMPGHAAGTSLTQGSRIPKMPFTRSGLPQREPRQDFLEFRSKEAKNQAPDEDEKQQSLKKTVSFCTVAMFNLVVKDR